MGPSLGQFYAGSYFHGISATALRGLGGVLLGIGVAKTVFATWGCVRDDDPCRDGSLEVTGGTLLYSGGLAYSLVETHFAVRRRASDSRSALSLGPTLIKTRQGSLSPGLLAQVRF